MIMENKDGTEKYSYVYVCMYVDVVIKHTWMYK